MKDLINQPDSISTLALETSVCHHDMFNPSNAVPLKVTPWNTCDSVAQRICTLS